MEKEQRSKAEFVKNGAPPVLGTGAKRKMGPPQGLHNGAPKVHKPQSGKWGPQNAQVAFWGEEGQWSEMKLCDNKVELSGLCPDEGGVITNEFSV